MSDSFTPEIRRHVGGFTATNGYAISTPQGWIGVDAPEGFADWLVGQELKLAALLLTHSHFDHVQDAARIQREHGCNIYAWETSTPESRLETWIFQMARMRLEVEDYPVDFPLKDLSEIEVCGIRWELFHVPGHSPDSVVFFDPASKQLFSGDTLMQGTMGRTDFPGGSTALLVRGMREKLLPLGNDVFVHAGHGESTTLGAERGWLERM